MMQRKYRIGEVANLLGIKAYVIRYWETEFPQLISSRTNKGQRLYTSEDIEKVRYIHHLLHEKGMTIVGVRKILSENNFMISALPKHEQKGGNHNAKVDKVFLTQIIEELTDIQKMLQK